MNAPNPMPHPGQAAGPVPSGDGEARPRLEAEAAQWLVRRQDGLTPPEQVELQGWLAADPARVVALDRLAALWRDLDGLPVSDVAALKAGLAAPQPVSRPPVTASRRPPLAPSRWAGLLPRLAGAGGAASVALAGWLAWSQWQLQPTYQRSLVSARGQQLPVALPDGSALRLDTATRLDVALYRQRREVRLPEGQAMFDIRRDPQRPFHVLAGPLRITVLGTRFSVRHTQAGLAAGQVHVVVEEGRVRVAQAVAAGERAAAGGPVTEGEFVELGAGQSVEADARGRFAQVHSVRTGAAMAWRDGRLVLSDVPLGEVLAEFERYADTGLRIRDPAVAALRLNGSFDLRQVPALRRSLTLALPVRLVPAPDGRTDIVAGR